MKKKMTSWFIALTGILFLSLGCTKDDPEPTKTETISRSPWIYQSATANGTDVSGAPQITCFIDNVITFNANGTGSIAEGTVICSPSTAGNFTWSFTANETQLVLSGPLFPGGGTTFNVMTVSETNLVISQTVTLPAPLGATLVIITFKH